MADEGIVWQAGDMTELKQRVHNGAVTALTPVGSHLLSGADDGSICLWERKVVFAPFLGRIHICVIFMLLCVFVREVLCMCVICGARVCLHVFGCHFAQPLLTRPP